MKSKLVLLLVVTCMSGGVAFAHHSFTATYDDAAKHATIKGEIVQFLLRNPHSFMHVSAPDENGQVQTWAVELGGNAQVQRMGITRDTLRPGDVVVVTGVPARNAATHRILLRRIERPLDGWKWAGEFD